MSGMLEDMDRRLEAERQKAIQNKQKEAAEKARKEAERAQKRDNNSILF